MAKHDHVRLNVLYHSPVTLPKLMQLAKDVTNHHSVSGQFFHTLVGKRAQTIIVALDREHLGDLFQSFDHFELADIAGVDDRVDVIEDRRYRLIEQTVSVRYDPDFHRKSLLLGARLEDVFILAVICCRWNSGVDLRGETGGQAAPRGRDLSATIGTFLDEERLPDSLIDFDCPGF
jgi:hypothetical protein